VPRSTLASSIKMPPSARATGATVSPHTSRLSHAHSARPIVLCGDGVVHSACCASCRAPPSWCNACARARPSPRPPALATLSLHAHARTPPAMALVVASLSSLSPSLSPLLAAHSPRVPALFASPCRLHPSSGGSAAAGLAWKNGGRAAQAFAHRDSTCPSCSSASSSSSCRRSRRQRRHPRSPPPTWR